MRFLKNKILRAQEALKKITPNHNLDKESQEENQLLLEAEIPPKQNPDTRKEESSRTKNIAVNYAQAISSFATSHLAVPYLQSNLEKENLSLKEFVNFIKREKTKMGGICSFRARLLVRETDTDKVAKCKRVFQWISEIFIKYFSANWIIHGKVTQKEIYLKFRYKMLRRIQNPESFVSIKDTKQDKSILN